MATLATEIVELRSESDVVRARQTARAHLVKLAFSLGAVTRIVTATSELARNAIDHGGGGAVTIEEITELGRDGVRLTFADQGPGIADVELALSDGFTTGGGLGLGLGGSRRLADEFEIRSTPNAGTVVTIVGWQR